MSEFSSVASHARFSEAEDAAASTPAAPSPVALTFLRGRDADGRIQRLVAERRALRPVLALLALRLVKRRAYERLGFRSLGDYARERLGVTARVVREWARVWDALAALPQLRAAVVSGEVSWSVVRRAVAQAAPETDAAFVEALRGRTVRAAVELLRVAFGPEAAGSSDGEERVRIFVSLAPEHQVRWLAALELARRMAGERLPVWECAEAIAAESLAALPPGVVAAAAGPSDGQASIATSRPAPRPKAVMPTSREHGLRHRAFRLLRWDRRDARPPDLERLAAWAETASPHALDRILRRAIHRLQRIDHDLAQILRQVRERRLYRELGFPSFERYAEERVDVSPRTARRWVRLARLGPAGSAVATAFRSGELSGQQAARVSESVVATQQSAAVAFARSVTLRRLEDALGATPGRGATLTFDAPPEAATVFLLALDAVCLHLQAVEPAAATAAHALLWMFDHALAAWTAQGDEFHDYADFARDGYRCTAPGCTARRNLQSHHIVFRSAGGPDETWNRTTLCAFHHLRGIHARTVSCSGLAPDALVFELGVRAAGPPLLRVGAGDVILSAEGR